MRCKWVSELGGVEPETIFTEKWEETVRWIVKQGEQGYDLHCNTTGVTRGAPKRNCSEILYDKDVISGGDNYNFGVGQNDALHGA